MRPIGKRESVCLIGVRWARLGLILLVIAILWANQARVFAQSATTGLITGVVTDPTGAVVPGTTVSLHQKGTNVPQSTVSDAAGRYSFPAVDPGDYSLQVTAKGFATEVIAVHVEVLKSLTVNLTLKVGQSNQTVEVTETSATQLQTTDSSIGNVLSGEGVARLPAYTRSATSLIFLQPGITPPSPSLNSAVSDILGGQVSGSRSEQVTFSLDGGDATSDIDGSDSYANPPGEPQPAPVIPTPLESTEEFRVTSSNPNATLNRSSGGQVALLTKHGTNSWHGSGYEYHSDDGLGANSWINDDSGVPKPHQVDNRFGGTVGGPIWKDRVFFFTNYEGRRLHDAASEVAIVPTDSMRNGILQFQDGTGTVQSYNFNPANGALASNCGLAGTSACDPRGLGVSPAIAAQLALYPSGNCSTVGDGLNTTGHCYSVATPIQADLGVMRLDFRLSNKWSLFGTYHVSRLQYLSQEQVDILNDSSLSTDPINGAFYTFELTGQITPQFTSSTHGSFLKNWWAWGRKTPAPLVTGPDATVEALALAGEGKGNATSPTKLLADPINIDTQNGRARVWDGHDWYIAQDFSWQRGHHLLQFGGSGYMIYDYHFRTDDVVGGLTAAPIDFIEANPSNGSAQFATVGANFEPAACGANGAAPQSNCLPGGSSLNYDVLYATILGMVDRSAQVETRNAQFQPNPLGSGLFDHVSFPAFYTYLQDVIQVRPSLTITAGVNWGVQLSPNEANGKQTAWVYANSMTPVNFWQYVDTRAAAFAQGQIVSPLLGIAPTDSLAPPFKGQMRQTTWHDIGPRISVAWQVPFQNRLFGNNATVIRGGYAMVFDRTEAVGAVLNPLLSGGLADVDECGGPVIGGSCSQAATDPTTAFRIGPTSGGWDGLTVPVPAPTALPVPDSPSPLGLYIAGPLDPYATPAHAHNVDFTVQRALPGNMFLEIGYVGKFSRNLAQGLNFTAPDYLAKDPASGQTLAQAFDAVATALNTGAAVTAQPFFEHVGGGCGAQSCTAQLAASPTAVGAFESDDLFTTMSVFDSIVAHPLDYDPAVGMAGLTGHGFSNYNAGFINVNKNFSHGLQMQFNWTWSHAIGNQGLNQKQDYTANSPFNLSLDKSSEVFDRKHTVNMWWYYTLPFGRGARYHSENEIVNQVIGGWYTSGIFTFATGLPTFIGADGDYGGSPGNFIVTGLAADFSKPLRGLVGLHGDGSAAGPNIFSTDASTLNSLFSTLSRPLLSVDDRVHFDELRLLPTWNFDLSAGKEIVKTERFKATFSADFLNAFNHPWLGSDPTTVFLDMFGPPGPGGFGSISSASNLPRRVLLGLRFDF